MGASLKAIPLKLLRMVLVVGLFMAMAGIGTYLTLTLIIKNEKTVIVPDLVGKDVLVGLEMLSDLGLNTRVKGIRYNDDFPQYHVIRQDPSPGSAIKRGRDVKIDVSRGPQSIVMPNLSGLSLQQGRILLTENGLCQGAVSRMHSSMYGTDQVMAHYPLPGAMVNRQSCVDLLVSQGARPPAAAMDDLEGFTLQTAVSRLQRLQLNLGHIRSHYTADAPLETIVAQIPPAGYPVSVGSAVDLTVNRSLSASSTDLRRSINEAALFRFRLNNGFLNKRVQVKLSQPRVSFNLFDDFMRPGQEIWLLIPKSGNPTVLVYVDGELVDSQVMDGYERIDQP